MSLKICGLNVIFAIIGKIWRQFLGLFCLREKLSDTFVPIAGQNPTTTPTIEPETRTPEKGDMTGMDNPTPKTQEQALLKALLKLGNRQNIWDPKIIYTWAHLEGSAWNEKEKKLYPFSTALVLFANNFWGLKKSSFWTKQFVNPLDKQLYNKFDSVTEAVGFIDLFTHKGYTKAYEVRNDYKAFFPLLKQGNWGAYCPGVNYAEDCIKRYLSLPSWKQIIKKVT